MDHKRKNNKLVTIICDKTAVTFSRHGIIKGRQPGKALDLITINLEKANMKAEKKYYQLLRKQHPSSRIAGKLPRSLD